MMHYNANAAPGSISTSHFTGGKTEMKILLIAELGFEGWQWVSRTRALELCAPLYDSPEAIQTAPATLGKEPGLKSPVSVLVINPSCFSCRVSLCLQNPACPWEAHLSCPARHARDYSLSLNGAAGATMQRCSPALRIRVPAPPSSFLWPALPPAQACSSVAVLNFGRKTWKDPL